MKNKIRSFLQLRKQSDTVKIYCLFVLATVVCLACVAYHAWGIYQYVNTPAEYMLTGEGMISGKRMDELMQNKDISNVSRQMKISVAVQYKGAETTVDCTMLSSDYLTDLSGTEIPEGASRIYMNEAAFAEFQEVISDKSGGMAVWEGQGSEEEASELTVRYSTGEDVAAARGTGNNAADSPEDGTGMRTAQTYGSAKLIVCKAGGEEAESFIYTAETERQLLQGAAGLRVRFERHDLDGLHVDNLRKLGYEIENEEILSAEGYELQTKLLHIGYGLVICGTCIVGAVMLWRSRFSRVNS